MLTPLLALALASSPAEAGRRACADLKPEQRLSEQQQRAVDAALSSGIRGGPSGHMGAVSERTVELRVLNDDDLARAWFLHQTCVMKATGLIDEGTARELVRDVMGLPHDGAAPSAPAPSARSSADARAATLEVKGAPGSAEVFVNGRPRGQIGEGILLPVEAGRVRVTVKKRGYRPVRSWVELAPGGHERVAVAGLSRRTSPVVWIAASMGVAAFAGTGVLIGAVAAETL